MAEKRYDGERGSDKGGLLRAVAVGLGFFAVAAVAGDFPIIDQTAIGQALDLMSGQMGTP